ncbi:hypothetical protein [Yoonia sp. I 8.24]|uniref:hypothetical protein n=1 Tax=Yoonia sp. I 8.24 TaxID=1537229 RepID=UPI001EE063AD|nr:hypothetical protein [Yoonia sp. I 8.24]MCG3267157.1 hypothetical protein [Yoonia sp. I 8.24]
MIEFGLESLSHADLAYQWHSGFASSDENISRLEMEQCKALAANGKLVVAKRINGTDIPEFVAVIYYDVENSTWVLGGLMTDYNVRGKGVAQVLCSLALGRLIALENPFGRSERIVSHVARSNDRPKRLLELAGFQKVASMKSSRETDEGEERWIDEYELKNRYVALEMLKKWAANWNLPLCSSIQKRSLLTLPPGNNIADWHAIFEVQQKYGT